MRRRSGRWSSVGSLVLPLAVTALAEPAVAQSDEQRANARGLATQGAQAFSEQRWQDAAELFDRAESLVHAPTHLLFAARAHVKLAHYVKARELYLRIIKQQLGSDAPRPFREAQTAAERELKEVEPHIGQLTISLKGGDPQLTKVTMDGAPVPSILIGVWRPVDPGEHELTAEAPGFRAHTTKVTIRDGGKASAMLELVAREPDAKPASAPPPKPEVPSSAPTTSVAAVMANDAPRVDEGTASPSNPMRVGSYVALGVGAVGIGLGTFFLVRSASERSEADAKFAECGGEALCTNGNPLSQDVTSLDDSARTAQLIGIVGLSAGGAALATGIVLLVLSGGSKKPTTGLHVMPRIGLGNVGAVGSF